MVYNIITERERKIPNTRKGLAMAKEIKLVDKKEVQNAMILMKKNCIERLRWTLQCEDCPFFPNCKGDSRPIDWEIGKRE